MEVYKPEGVGIMAEKNITLKDIVIDEEFRQLLPPLDAQTYSSLEQSILDYGCMNPLVLWNNTLIDGYNRYKILTEHGLPFNTMNLEFSSRNEVLIWIISTQVSRRNLTTMQLTYFRGLHYNTDKKLHGDAGRLVNNPSGHDVHLGGNTANRLSEQYSVTSRTIRRDGQIADMIDAIGRASPDAKRDILSGAARINRKQLRDLASSSDDDIEMISSEIVTGIFNDKIKAEVTDLTRTSVPGNNDKSDFHEFITFVINQLHEFINDVQSIPLNTDPIVLRKLIRTHMQKLEASYKQLN